VLITDRKGSAPLANLADKINIRQVLLAPASYRAESDTRPLTIPDGIEIDKLLPAETIEVEPGVWLTLTAEDLNGTALLLQYGGFKVLIPNGVDFAVIKSTSPNSMTELTALVLGPEDVSTIPPRVWRNLGPQMILWRDHSVSPFETSLGVDESMDVYLVTNGIEVWHEK
jgi:hypothetical protein